MKKPAERARKKTRSGGAPPRTPQGASPLDPFAGASPLRSGAPTGAPGSPRRRLARRGLGRLARYVKKTAKKLGIKIVFDNLQKEYEKGGSPSRGRASWPARRLSRLRSLDRIRREEAAPVSTDANFVQQYRRRVLGPFGRVAWRRVPAVLRNWGMRGYVAGGRDAPFSRYLQKQTPQGLSQCEGTL
jgi:hypothetical protein